MSEIPSTCTRGEPASDNENSDPAQEPVTQERDSSQDDCTIMREIGKYAGFDYLRSHKPSAPEGLHALPKHSED